MGKTSDYWGTTQVPHCENGTLLAFIVQKLYSNVGHFSCFAIFGGGTWEFTSAMKSEKSKMVAALVPYFSKWYPIYALWYPIFRGVGKMGYHRNFVFFSSLLLYTYY